MDNDQLTARVERIERALVLLTAMLDKIHVATDGHQHCITAFAEILGIKLEPLPAAPAGSAN